MSSQPNGWPVRWALLRPASGRSAGGAGYVLVIGGFALSVVTLFAFPLEHWSSQRFRGLTLGFSDLRRLSGQMADPGSGLNPDSFTKFSGFWWSSGLLVATCALAVLVAAIAAGVQRAGFALAVALVAGATTVAHVYAMLHTLQYGAMVVPGEPEGTMISDATPATGVSLVGLVALVVGGMWMALRFTARAGRRATVPPQPPAAPALPTAR